MRKGVQMSAIEFISLIRLIQVPEQYHGKQVRVVGYAVVEFERKALYISADDARNALTKNAVWLNFPLTDANRKLSGKYVLVEGTFDKDNKGHLKLYSGSLKDVTRFELWSEGKDEKEKPKS